MDENLVNNVVCVLKCLSHKQIESSSVCNIWFGGRYWERYPTCNFSAVRFPWEIGATHQPFGGINIDLIVPRPLWALLELWWLIIHHYWLGNYYINDAGWDKRCSSARLTAKGWRMELVWIQAIQSRLWDFAGFQLFFSTLLVNPPWQFPVVKMDCTCLKNDLKLAIRYAQK